MTKKITKKEENKPVKIFSPGDIRKMALDSSHIHFGMLKKIKKLGEEKLPAYYAGNDPDGEAIIELNEVSRALSLDSGHNLIECVDKNYQELTFQMKQDFHKEFDCNTATEKALVDLAVSSYISKMHYTKLLHLNYLKGGKEYDNFRNSASKEIDRAHRQFMSTIECLKMMKQPSMRVNIKTNNAFVGENQQFNNNVENNESK